MWQFQLGGVTVSRVEEMLTPGFDPAFLFPAFDPTVFDEDPQLRGPNFWDAATGKLMSSMQSWLLRIGRDIVLIDTGCGNGEVREEPAFRRFHQLSLPYLATLEAAGAKPEDVTVVVNTHLHVDHVGWNTRLQDGRWVPTFPHARYLIGRAEWAHWQNPQGGPAFQPEGVPAIMDSVQPVWDAGLVDLMDDGDEVVRGLVTRAAPGHTAGQLAIELCSAGATGIFTADVFHQPMQVVRPDWTSRYCEVPDVAVATRRRILGEAAASRAVLFPSHPGAPHAGRVQDTLQGLRFVPLDAAELGSHVADPPCLLSHAARSASRMGDRRGCALHRASRADQRRCFDRPPAGRGGRAGQCRCVGAAGGWRFGRDSAGRYRFDLGCDGVVQIRITRETWNHLIGAALATFGATHKSPV